MGVIWFQTDGAEACPGVNPYLPDAFVKYCIGELVSVSDTETVDALWNAQQSSSFEQPPEGRAASHPWKTCLERPVVSLKAMRKHGHQAAPIKITRHMVQCKRNPLLCRWNRGDFSKR